MDFIMETLLLLAVALAMDSVAVSIAIGSKHKELPLSTTAVIAAVFGFFQGAMPFAGYYTGIGFAHHVQTFSHWIAFFLLAGLGGKMAYEAYKDEFDEEVSDLSLKTLLALAIATSIDAMAVGVTFAFVQNDILSASALIALVTFALCWVAIFIGKKVGGVLESKAELLGGLILIGLGCKILFDHFGWI